MTKLALLLSLIFWLASCDVNKELDKAFADAGLARINAPRTDYAPGAIILKGKKQTIYANNISDYVGNASLTITTQDNSKEVDAILPKLSVTRNINPSLASDFIVSTLPVNDSLDLKFTSNVDMDQMNCRISTVKIVDLQKFIRDPKNAELATSFKDFANEKAEIYIAYEVWSASSMNFSASTGDNIDTDVKVGEIKPLLKSADAKFSYSKTSTKSLKVTGDKFYPFALRLAKVVINPQTGALNLKFTDFKLNIDVKAASDVAYSALPNADGAALLIDSVSRDQIMKALRSN